MAIVEDAPITVVAQVGNILLDGDVVERLRDEDSVARLLELLTEVAAPDLECVMVAPDYVGPRGRLSYTGPEGFVEAWREWVEAYEHYTIEIEDIVEGTEGRVLIIARQRGRTRVGGVEVEELAAAVWTVSDGKLARMEFHLDPETARRDAGLDERTADSD
jgi:ketosteroid isomerase-like protein